MRNIFIDGTKSIDLPQYPDSAWQFYSNPPEMDKEDLYGRVAAVYRAANMTANATAAIPFALVNAQSGEDYDTSDDWKNLVGFMPDPVELLRLWRLSLTMTNTAYGFMEGKTLGKRSINTNLRYIVPSTLSPVVDNDGLKMFKRSVNNVTTEYQPLPEPGGRILYMWRLDHTTEILPSPKTEYLAMMNAAGILYYSDTFIKSFFQRGGIKPTMLTVKGNILKDAMEKLESIWTKVIRGEYKYLGKVFNGDAIDATVIGEGVESLKDQGITDNSLAAVAMAIGMPLSLLLANSANYATAQTEYVTWYRDTLTPWCNFMASCLNNQIFTPMGLRFEFRPEMTDPGQEDEVSRAGAYSSYVNAGMLPSIAAQIVGIELPAGIEFIALDPAPEPETEPVQEPVEETSEGETEMQAEMRRWRKKATKALKAGKPALVEFVSDIIPDDARQYIERCLANATCEYEIRAAFLLDNMPAQPAPPEKRMDTSAIMALAQAINGAAEVKQVEPQILRSEPQQSVIFDVTGKYVQMNEDNTQMVMDAIAGINTTIAEQQAIIQKIVEEYEMNDKNTALIIQAIQEMANRPLPEINIPAPVVNVPAAIVTVEPPKVTVQAPKRERLKAKVIRDMDGRIIGMESE